MKPRPLLAALLLPVLVPACTGWPRGWNKAKSLLISSTAPTPAGAWIGTWHSAGTGHTGKLRCAVFPLPEKSPATAPTTTASTPAAPQLWQFRYRASWAKILCAGFTVDCEATQQPGGTWKITGQRDLGPLFGGVFTHTGTLNGNQLEAEYHAAADHGSLSLQRLAPP